MSAGVLEWRSDSWPSVGRTRDWRRRQRLRRRSASSCLQRRSRPAVAAGQMAPPTLAYSTGHRTPAAVAAGLARDDRGAAGLSARRPAGCLPAGHPGRRPISSATQSGAALSLTWNLPVSPSRTGVRLEVGSVDGRADLFMLDLPANQQAFSATAPPGSYFARVRALAGVATSMTTPDVSFAAGHSRRPARFHRDQPTDRASPSPGTRHRRARRHATNSRPAPPKAAATSARSVLPERPRR